MIFNRVKCLQFIILLITFLIKDKEYRFRLRMTLNF